MRLPLVESSDSDVSQRRRAVETVPVSAVRSVGRGEDSPVVAVEGAVRAHERTVPAPVSGEDCVVAAYELRRRTDGGRYEVVERRVGSVPFVVADNTGEVVVDPTDAGDDDADTAGRPEGADPFAISPGNTDWFVGDRDGESVRPVPDPSAIAPDRAEWVHRVATIRPGEDVYVLGAPVDGGEGVRIRPGEAFVVSDLGRSALVEALRRASPELSSQFLRFAALGFIAAVIVLGVAVILVVTFAP